MRTIDTKHDSAMSCNLCSLIEYSRAFLYMRSVSGVLHWMEVTAKPNMCVLCSTNQEPPRQRQSGVLVVIPPIPTTVVNALFGTSI